MGDLLRQVRSLPPAIVGLPVPFIRVRPVHVVEVSSRQRQFHLFQGRMGRAERWVGRGGAANVWMSLLSCLAGFRASKKERTHWQGGPRRVAFLGDSVRLGDDG